MAGFFGLFNYEKEGPGIEKNAPKKRAFIVFFETFFRNIWKFIRINLMYVLLSLPIVTGGLANVGITDVTRNIARDKHSFLLYDFFKAIKKNWKQGLIVRIINIIAYSLLFFAARYYFKSSSKIAVVGLGVCISIFIIFSFMNYFIWTLLITFNFSIKQLYSNSFKFAIINLKGNVICGLSMLLVYGINIGILLITDMFKVSYFAVFIELILAVLFLPSFRFLLIQYCTFPSIKKCIIDPYYANNPDADIEKRRDLGVYEEPDEEEDEEEDENEETPEFEPENEIIDETEE